MNCSPWNSPGQNIRVGSLSLLHGIFPTQGSNQGLRHCRQILYCLSHQGSPLRSLGPLTVNGTFTKLREIYCLHACRLSRFSHVRLCATLWTAVHQAPLSTGFSRQEYWSSSIIIIMPNIIGFRSSVKYHYWAK